MERRQETNKRAVDVLMNHLQIWNHVDGPPPEEELLDPSEIAILSAKDCCHALARMAEAHGSAKNELVTYVEEVTEAVASIQMLTWESIRVDRFSLTPPELYYDIVGNARSHLARRDEEAARRRARLADIPAMQPEGEADAAGAEADAGRHDEAGYVRILPKDRYDIDIDREFKGFLKEDGEVRKVRKPLNWQRAVDLATEVLLNEMRALLETVCRAQTACSKVPL
jgi:hypothetical protein